MGLALPYVQTVRARILYVGIVSLLVVLAMPPFSIPELFPLAFVFYPTLNHHELWESIPMGVTAGGIVGFLGLVFLPKFSLLIYFVAPFLYMIACMGLFAFYNLTQPIRPWKLATPFVVLWVVTPEVMFVRPGSLFGSYPILLQPAHLIGETLWGGVTLLGLGAVAGLVYSKKRQYLAALGCLVLFLGLLGQGAYRFVTKPRLTHEQTVALIQPAVPAPFYGSPDRAKNKFKERLRVTRTLIRNKTKPRDLVVTPEGTGPGGLFRADKQGRFHRKDNPQSSDLQFLRLVPGKRSYIFGMSVFNDQLTPNRFNGAVMVNENKDMTGFYTKSILMPFGEYVPGARYFDSGLALERYFGSPARRGEHTEPLFHAPSGLRLGLVICIEDTQLDYYRKHYREGADVLIGLTNDSWSRSDAVHWLHHYRVQIRAIESGYAIARSGITGVTSLLDPYGRGPVIRPYEKGVLRAKLPVSEPTIYLRYGNSILGAGLLLFLLPSILPGIIAWRQ